MKKLEPLTVSHLTQLEFGQHTKRIHAEITDPSATPITDTTLIEYLADLNLKNLAYDKALVQITKSDETAKIVHADELRDKCLSTLQRYLSVFEYNTDPAMQSCYVSLNNLFNNYKRMQFWNFEEETNGIDNLISDLESDRYSNSVDMLGMLSYMLDLKACNASFNTIFSNRNREEASREVFDVKQLRRDLKTSYENIIRYVLAMAIAKDTAEYNNTLSTINVNRKYYADLLARRKPEPKPVTPSAN